jgi:hypothetical protein
MPDLRRCDCDHVFVRKFDWTNRKTAPNDGGAVDFIDGFVPRRYNTLFALCV